MGSGGGERCFDVTGAAGHAQVCKRDTDVKKDVDEENGAADNDFNSFRLCASCMLGSRRGGVELPSTGCNAAAHYSRLWILIFQCLFYYYHLSVLICFVTLFNSAISHASHIVISFNGASACCGSGWPTL